MTCWRPALSYALAPTVCQQLAPQVRPIFKLRISKFGIESNKLLKKGGGFSERAV